MKNRARLLFFVVIVLCVLWAGFVFLAPKFAAAWAQREFHDLCQICELEIGTARVSLFAPTRIEIRNLRLRAGTRDFEEVEAKVSRLRAIVSLRAAWRNEIKIQDIELEGVDVVLTDGDGPRGPGAGGAGLPDFLLEGIELRGGNFTYVRNLKKTHAVFKAHKIDASFVPFGTLEGTNKIAKGRATGRIENSGSIALDLAVHVRPLRPLTIDLAVHAREQNLADLTAFFKENAGVVLNGELLRGEARATVRGSRLSAEVEATYKDFQVKVEPMWDRDETAAFFTNLGTSIAMREKNLGKPQSEKRKNVELEREPGEPIVAFILRGLKEAAIGVATR